MKVINNKLFHDSILHHPPEVQEQLKVFAQDPDQRSYDDIKKLVPFLKDLQAFKDIEIDDTELIRLIYSISLFYYPDGAVLFRAGDIGDCFFIVLTGGIDVYMPNQELRPVKLEI